MARFGVGALIQSLRSRQVVAGVLVTALTLAVIGVVLVAATPIGCGPANALGLKTLSGKCIKPLVSKATSPSPSVLSSPSPAESPTPIPSPSPESSPSPFPSAAPPDDGPATGSYPPFFPAATGSGGIAVPSLRLNCRLPVFAGPPGSGGFIVFPGGTFVADPRSAVSLPSPSPGRPSPSPVGGYGLQQPGLSYDAAYSKWVPVPTSQVTPDGSRYAFVSPDSIYVEDVASGTLTEIGEGNTWVIVGVQAAGVYASHLNKAGLWFLPFTGAVRQVTAAGFWQAASADYAFGTQTSAVPQGAANVIIRLDLKSGTTSNWFTRKAAQSFVVGLDRSGHAIVSVNYFAVGGVEIWIATGAGVATPITGTGSGLYVYGQAISDSNGVWFNGSYNQNGYSSTNGFALYVKGSGMYWMSNLGAQLAGGCIQP